MPAASPAVSPAIRTPDQRVGKTRLAVEAARRLAPAFPDGVRFVDLAPVRTADLVSAAIAAGLGLNTSGDRLVSDVLSYLRARRLLLILDNFEQVIDGAAAPSPFPAPSGTH